MDLFPAQAEDSKRLAGSVAKVLGNGIGSGKTRVVLSGFQQLSGPRYSSLYRQISGIADVLILVGPASVAYHTWPKEIDKVWPGVKHFSMNASKDKRMLYYDQTTKTKGPFILLMSYEIMTRDVDVLRLLQRVVGNVIVADEAHAFKHHNSQRSKAWRKLVAGAACSWLVTGTLGEKPAHYFGVDQALGQSTFGTWPNFLNKYCITNTVEIKTASRSFNLKVPVGFKPSAFKTIEEWTKKFVIRRPPDESKLPILLPPLERIVELSQSKRTEYNALKKNPEGESRMKNFFKLRGLAAEAKLDDLIENLLPQLLEDRVTLIFTPFLTQASRIKARIEKELGIECAEFSGDVSQKQRAHYLEELGKRYKVLVMTEAGKEGVDGFQVASALVFYDYPWSESDRRQIIGRIRRTGQEREDVLIITQHVTKSADDKMKQLLEDKNFSLDFLINLAEAQWEELYKSI